MQPSSTEKELQAIKKELATTNAKLDRIVFLMEYIANHLPAKPLGR